MSLALMDSYNPTILTLQQKNKQLHTEISKRDERIKDLEYSVDYAEGYWEDFRLRNIEFSERNLELKERIKDLEAACLAYDRKWHDAQYSADELAAQNQRLRDLLPKRIPNRFVSFGKHYSEQEDLFADPYNQMSKFKRQYLTQCEQALALPDIASPVLNRVKAEALRNAATYLESYDYIKNQPPINYAEAFELRMMADAIEKGEG